MRKGKESPEEALARRRKYNRDWVRKWRAANREKANQRQRDWRAANPGYDAQCARKWRSNHPEKARESVRKWHAAHRDTIRELNRKWQEANRDKANLTHQKWRKANPGKVKAMSHKRYIKMRDALRIVSGMPKRGKRGRKPGRGPVMNARIDLAAAFHRLGWSEHAMAKFVYKDTPGSAYPNTRNLFSDHRQEIYKKSNTLTLKQAEARITL